MWLRTRFTPATLRAACSAAFFCRSVVTRPLTMARFSIARETCAARIFLCAGLFAAAGWRSLVGVAGAFFGAGFAIIEEFSAAFSVRTGDGISADFSLSGRGRLLVPESLIGGERTSPSGIGLV